MLWGAGCGAFLACPGTFCKGGVCSVWPAHWIHRGCFKLKLDCNQNIPAWGAASPGTIPRPTTGRLRVVGTMRKPVAGGYIS